MRKCGNLAVSLQKRWLNRVVELTKIEISGFHCIKTSIKGGSFKTGQGVGVIAFAESALLKKIKQLLNFANLFFGYL